VTIGIRDDFFYLMYDSCIFIICYLLLNDDLEEYFKIFRNFHQFGIVTKSRKTKSGKYGNQKFYFLHS
jgi:hypothetical protein